MIKRRLGRTNLEVSIIGFGGIPVQRVDNAEAHQILKRASELGANFLDSARGYTISEERIGHGIHGQRDQWILATKSMAGDYESMKRDIQISLDNFQTDYIDLYQFHFVKDMEKYDQIMGENGAYKALKEAQEEGKIGYIGITSHAIDVLERAVETDCFDTIQFPYNLIERQGEKLFERAKQKDIGVIVMKPIGGGAIDNGELSIKFILQNDNISTIIPGMEKVEEVEKNMPLGKRIEPLTEAEAKEVEHLRENLGMEFCRRCGYCQPCPEGINIPAVFIFEGYLTRYELEHWAHDRYDALDIKPDKCVQCGACELKCPYGLPIREMLKKAEADFSTKR